MKLTLGKKKKEMMMMMMSRSVIPTVVVVLSRFQSPSQVPTLESPRASPQISPLPLPERLRPVRLHECREEKPRYQDSGFRNAMLSRGGNGTLTGKGESYSCGEAGRKEANGEGYLCSFIR